MDEEDKGNEEQCEDNAKIAAAIFEHNGSALIAPWIPIFVGTCGPPQDGSSSQANATCQGSNVQRCGPAAAGRAEEGDEDEDFEDVRVEVVVRGVAILSHPPGL